MKMPKLNQPVTSLAKRIAVTLLTTVVLPLMAAPPVAPVLTPFIPGANGIVSGQYSQQMTVTGTATSFAATGLPKGITINPKTGLISGRVLVAGNYTITITAANGASKSVPLIFPWTVEPLPVGTVGTYNALLDRQTWYNGGYGGSVRLTVNTDGSYSGVITRGYYRNSIVGRLETQVGGVAPVSYFTVPRRAPHAPLEIAFTLPIGSGQIYGNLKEPQGVTINFFGFRAAYSKTRPATGYSGRWNSATEIPTGLIGNVIYPQGAGWATQTVSDSGIVLWTGRLADGTSYTYSTNLAENGQAALHVMLYKYYGSIQGWQTINKTTGLCAASLSWVKTANGDRSYGTGFPLHSLAGSGGRYSRPTDGGLVFGIHAGSNNAVATFSQGGLSSVFYQVFTVGSGNRLALPVGDTNPYRLRAGLNVTTGIISGSGTAMNYNATQPTNLRKGTFSALLIPGREQAVGHFLLPTDQSPYAPILSGKFIAEETSVNN